MNRADTNGQPVGQRRGVLGRTVGALGDALGTAIGGPLGDTVSSTVDRTVGAAVDAVESALPAGTVDRLEATPIGSVVRAVPDIAKVTGELLRRTNRVAISTSLHLGGIVVRGAIDGRSADVVVEQLNAEARATLRELLGVGEGSDPLPTPLRERIGRTGRDTQIGLPERLHALLDASADVTCSDDGHPAYVRLLSELSPDEARILRLFAERGPQPSVDVRTKRPFGIGSQLVARGITMIGRYAGCTHVDRVPAYLNNMFRLGLIWFSREPVPDQSVYDVLEVQEEVEAALKRAGNGVTVRRSIELTAFGANLCAVCGLLPMEQSTTGATRETVHQLPPPDEH
ncbi:protein of unknown function [Pseudonocardia thermophila]|uniref:DUF4393 domain-containing protein n=1 Tax=Pseudonocardia thermophila TaxID=1848 RepID=A0A1M6Q090_PSETH|nr:Abi-alpha family protein [Pseudonocardia thermophila]SHK13624.1 protein of unknown function [Pseudonocardia thermophila]